MVLTVQENTNQLQDYIPENKTRFYISKKTLPLEDKRISYYLGQHNVYVGRIKKLTQSSYLAFVRYNKEEDIMKLYGNDEHPMKIRRVFKSAFYQKGFGKDLNNLNGLFADTIANLLGLLDGKKAKINIIVDPHRTSNKAIKDKFVQMGMKFRDEKKIDVEFNPKESNIFFHIQVITEPEGNIITWLEDPNRLIRKL